ncbi:MAG: hypothetical protein QOE48_1702, partial [Mycobacterium sp.]|nr:hypothetical protein [Mycobacterium sp.]
MAWQPSHHTIHHKRARVFAADVIVITAFRATWTRTDE